MLPERKLCPRCGLTKSAAHFDRANKDGKPALYTYCRPCRKQRHTLHTHFLSLLRSSRRRRPHQHTITLVDLNRLWNKQRGRCALTGMCMTHIHGHGQWPTNVTIDRIHPSGPYTPDNVRLVSHWANVARSNYPIKRFKYFCRRAASWSS